MVPTFFSAPSWALMRSTVSSEAGVQEHRARSIERSRLNGKEVPLARHTPQCVVPPVLELKTRTHRKILNSAGDKHLIRGCESRHPGPDVDGQPSHVVSNQFALAGMESSPNLDPELAKAVPNSAGAPDSAART